MGGEQLTLKCDKQKDASRFKSIVLKLVVKDLGEDEEGNKIESCVVERARGLGPSLFDEFSKGHRFRVLRALAKRDDGATFTELEKGTIPELTRGGIPDSTLRRDLEFLTESGYAAKPKPPGSRGGKYTATDDGRAAYKKVAAKRAQR